MFYFIILFLVIYIILLFCALQCRFTYANVGLIKALYSVLSSPLTQEQPLPGAQVGGETDRSVNELAVITLPPTIPTATTPNITVFDSRRRLLVKSL